MQAQTQDLRPLNYRPLPAKPTDRDYFSLLTRKMFHAGFNRESVDRRWASFEKAFAGFEPAVVATFDGAKLEMLFNNPSIIRNRSKIQAVVANARHFVEVAETHGAWTTWLEGMNDLPYEQMADTLGACLTHCGPTTIFYFLFEAGLAVLDDKPEFTR